MGRQDELGIVAEGATEIAPLREKDCAGVIGIIYE